MLRMMCKSKIHGATVTDANLKYRGSITIDANLMAAAGLLPHEWVHVVNVNNGNRLETYTITGEAGSGVICLNGAAARLVQPGDKVIIMSYAGFAEDELHTFHHRVIFVDEQNRIVEQ